MLTGGTLSDRAIATRSTAEGIVHERDGMKYLIVEKVVR